MRWKSQYSEQKYRDLLAIQRSGWGGTDQTIDFNVQTKPKFGKSGYPEDSVKNNVEDNQKYQGKYTHFRMLV